MAEMSEELEKEAVNTPARETQKQPARSKGGLLFAIVVLLLIMAVAGAGYYLLTQLRNKQEGLGGEVKSQLTSQISNYQAQLTEIQKQVANLQSEISGKEEHFNKTLESFSDLNGQKLEATRQELSEKVLQVQRQLGKTRGDWLIADAEYLLSVANERLQLVGDVNTTKAALEAADQRLRESGDSGTIKIREQIAKELSLVQNIKIPDMVGLYVAIQALESDAGNLSLLLPYSGKPLTKPEEAAESRVGNDETNDLVSSAIHELEGIVTIKHTDQPIKEILTKEQADFIHAQLKLKLDMAKVALVQQNDALYQKGLSDVSAWTKSHFVDNEVTKRFSAELNRLMAVNLRSQLPDISLSLKMLRDVTKLRLETDKTLLPDGGQEKVSLPSQTLPTQEATGIPESNSVPEDSKASGEPEQPTQVEPEKQ